MKLPLLLFFLTSCTGQLPNRTVSLTAVGWSFELPKDVSFKDSSFNRDGEIKESSWKKSSFNQRERVELFWIETDRNNYFNCIVFKDTSDFTSWLKNTVDDSKFYLDAMASSTKFRLIDSSISSHKIDNVEFQTEYLKILNVSMGDTTYSYKVSRKFHNYDVNINIRATNSKIGGRYLSILEGSKFNE